MAKHAITKTLLSFTAKVFSARKDEQNGIFCSSSWSSQCRTLFSLGSGRKTRLGRGNLVSLVGTHID